jgi:2-C-methyl-D-erythritol 4-phosphate cytidylyltransferase
MVSVFDILLQMLEFVSWFHTKIVIVIDATRPIILGPIWERRYSGSIVQRNALSEFLNSR